MKLFLVILLFLMPNFTFAAAENSSDLSLLWILPFAGILLAIALLPILTPKLWHHHFGKIIAALTFAFLGAFVVFFGVPATLHLLAHALLTEYLPFIILLLALYTISGGILIWGSLNGTPLLNTAILAIGTLLASIMGTTGAAMLLIRPLLRANIERKYQVHTVVFFIFLVANIGGGLTPLGDPPLFLGFLKGVTFGWTVWHMLAPVLLASVCLLLIFFALDNYFWRKENHQPKTQHQKEKFKIYGLPNLGLLFLVVIAVLLSGIYKDLLSFTILETKLELSNLMRDGFLLLLVATSILITPKQVRAGNEFNFAPIIEVAKIFSGIFITIVPAIAILKASSGGALSFMFSDNAPNNLIFFWITGLLSAFLDNAPTYLVFFNLASGDAQILMTQMPQTLMAISMGAVFMGAVTYIGNAPNFMVKAIAEQKGIKMPSFFGYMIWSISLLIPIFLLLSLIFFI